MLETLNQTVLSGGAPELNRKDLRNRLPGRGFETVLVDVPGKKLIRRSFCRGCFDEVFITDEYLIRFTESEKEAHFPSLNEAVWAWEKKEENFSSLIFIPR